MFNWFKREVSKLNDLINKPEEKSPENMNYLEYLIFSHRGSPIRKNQIIGDNYYRGKHDILKKQRTMIGQNGKLEVVDNIPNNKRIDNQYGIHVNKKVNYLMGKVPTYTSENNKLTEAVKDILNNRFTRTLKNTLKHAINGGIGYMYVYLNDKSELQFKTIKPYESIPVWEDDSHEKLNFFVRVYKQIDFVAGQEREIEYAEVYGTEKLTRYKLHGNTPVRIEEIPYITRIDDEIGYNWQGIVPIIPFKYNAEEIPLILKVKSLQDGINEILSNFNDNMDESPRNTILVIQNYDGQNLGEFRRNLATYGAVKVKNDGDVRGLQVEVNASNYLSILEVLKNALIENAMSYDAKDDRLSGNPNQMNIQSMYSDIDIDSNALETEFKASFEELSDFIKMYLVSVKGLSFADKDIIDITFNKDVLINESQVVSDIKCSVGVLSNETLIENHPYIDDVQKELKRIQGEKEKAMQEIETHMQKEDRSAYNDVGAGHEE